MQIHLNFLYKPIGEDECQSLSIELWFCLMHDSVVRRGEDHLIVGIIIKRSHEWIDMVGFDDMNALVGTNDFSCHLATIIIEFLEAIADASI